MKRIAVYVVLALVVLGVVAWGATAYTDYRLRKQIAAKEEQATKAEQEAEAARTQAASEIKQAKDEMTRWRQEADRRSQENHQLVAERKALLEKLTATATTLAQIREEAARVPASELLGRLRRALVALRQPVLGGGTPAH
jgi:flagellar biosynthesis/type III secretory pathway M-ring protein FliF/YscJ